MQNISRSCFNTASPAAQRTPAAARFVTIIDPAFRSGKIDIPIEKTTMTKGRDEWIEGKLRNRDLSLCCLFQKGRCHAQERCHQVHADRDYVTSLRNQQSTVVSCCRHCHDTASLSSAAMNFFAANMPTASTVKITFGEADEPNAYPASRLAFTDGLIQQFRDHGCKEVHGVIDIPARRVCRLHAKGVCKYGKDCKNVHVCCQLGEAVMVRPNPATPAKAMSPAAAIRSPAYVHAAARRVSEPAPVARAMPVFAIPSSAPIMDSKDGLESTAVPSGAKSRSGVIKALDADSLNESSGRLRALVFDVLKCLEDSRVEPKRASGENDDDENFSYFSSTKTSSRTVASNASDNGSPNIKLMAWNAWHPAAANNTPNKVNIVSPAAVDTTTFLRGF
jgi:hypothetical protein